MPRILYRADGGHPVGMGHIQRALRVSAWWNQSAPSVRVLLVAAEDAAVCRLISEAAPANLTARYLGVPGQSAVPRVESAPIAEVAAEFAPDIVVIDMLDTAEVEMRRLREISPTLVSLDDRGEGRLYSDLIVNFLVRDPDPSALDRDRTWLREGPEYASLASEFVGVARGRREPAMARRALVSTGGADAAGLVVKVAVDLLSVKGLADVDFAVGPAFRKMAELESVTSGAPWRANVHVSLPSLLPLYATADLAIVAGGITMHEAACCGTPAIAVCQSIDHQVMVAGWLQEAGCMLNLGYGEKLAAGEIAMAVASLIADQPRRQSMSDAGPRVCDGRGSERTAEAILARWNPQQGAGG